MFNPSENPEVKRFTIVYDKSTEKIANSLYNLSSKKKFSCACWSEKQYLDQKPRFTNENKVFFFGKDQISKNLSSPFITPINVTEYAQLKIQENCAGLIINGNPSYYKAKNDLQKYLVNTLNDKPSSTVTDLVVSVSSQFLGYSTAAALLAAPIIEFGGPFLLISHIKHKREAKEIIAHIATMEFYIKYIDSFVGNEE